MGPVGFLAALVAVAAAALGAAADEIDVNCEGKTATLTVQGNNANYSCSNEPSREDDQPVTMAAYFKVSVNAETLNLDIQEVDAVNVNILEFIATNEMTKLAFPGEELSFVSMQNLGNLSFTGFEFEETVNLALPNTTREIHFVNSSLSDLSLTKQATALYVIDLAGTTLSKLPEFLYERNLTSHTITANLTTITQEKTLTKTEFDVLSDNVEGLNLKTWAQAYNASLCTQESEDKFVCNSAASSSSSTELDTSDVARPDGAGTSSSSDSGSTGSADAGDSSGVSTGALVAIIVVVVVIALVLAFFILRMYFRRKAANASAQNEATTTLMSKGDATADKGSFISNDEFLRNFRLPQSDVSLVKSVGTGRLWMGEYNSEKVIVKRVESEVTDSFVTKALMAQARSFATISHPNITNLVGVTWLAGTDFAVVTEFMDKGNLKTVLSNTEVGLDVTTKLQMCLDVALALAYLHESEQNMCAKKLSSRKVLVNNALSCKLSLFECVPSSAKIGGPGTYSYGMGEVAWLAPEIITRSSPMDARKNNMFAFGVLVSEIFTRVSPYQKLIQNHGNTLSDVELVQRVRRQQPLLPHEDRPAFLEAPASVRQLVEQCLLYAPMSRPTAKDLVDVLHRAKEELATDVI